MPAVAFVIVVVMMVSTIATFTFFVVMMMVSAAAIFTFFVVMVVMPATTTTIFFSVHIVDNVLNFFVGGLAILDDFALET